MWWRRVFLILETIVVVSVVITIVAERQFGLILDPGDGVFGIALTVTLILAWLFLLIASPIFLRSLRGVALAGWIIAFGMFLLGMLTPAL